MVIVKHLQRLRGINGDYDNESGSSGDNAVGRRRTIYNLEKQRQKTRTIGTLDVAFRKRFLQMKIGEDEDEPQGTVDVPRYINPQDSTGYKVRNYVDNKYI